MEFSVLGPLEVRAGARAVSLGGAKPRGVLAFLLLHAGEPVSADRLARALWGDDPRAPLPPVPRAGRAPRQRARAVGRGPQGASGRAGCGRREPPRGAAMGARRGR